VPFVYVDVDSLVTPQPKPNVGSGHCVPLVQQFAGCPPTAEWTKGVDVRNHMLLLKGTAIATFVNGKYPNAGTGNHAALYVSQDSAGVWVVDQYVGSNGIKKRHLKFKGKAADGRYVDPTNNGDAFSVIET